MQTVFQALTGKLGLEVGGWSKGAKQAIADTNAFRTAVTAAMGSAASSAGAMFASAAGGMRTAQAAMGGVTRTAAAAMSSIVQSAGRAAAGVASAGQQTAVALRGMAVEAGKTATQVSAAAAAISAALFLVAGDSVKTAAGFEQSISRVKGLLSGGIADPGQLDEATKSLSELAKKLGAETVYSAKQAADAMGFFALAGFKAEEIAAAMPATLNLAAAGQMDISIAADIAAKVMRGMGIEATELTHVTDVLTKAFTTSNTDLQQLGLAMKYVGPIAKAAGVSLEDTVAPLQVMSDAGIQASMAGTSLRGILGSLSQGGNDVRRVFGPLGVEFKNVDGSLRPLADIVDDFNRRLDETGTRSSLAGLAITAFGDRAGPGFVTLLESGGSELRRFSGALEGAGGTAERIARIQLDNLAGSWVILTSALEGARIGIGERLAPSIRLLVEQLTQWVSLNVDGIAESAGVAWQALSVAVERTAAAFSAVLAIVQPVASQMQAGFSSALASGQQLFGQLPAWSQNLLIVVGSLTGLSAILGGIGGGIPIIGGLFVALGSLLSPLRLVVSLFGVFAPLLTALPGIFGALLSAVNPVTIAFAAVAASVYTAIEYSDSARESLTSLMTGATEVAGILIGHLSEAFRIVSDYAMGFWDRTEGLRVKIGEVVLVVADYLMPVFKILADIFGNVLVDTVQNVIGVFDWLLMGLEAVIDLVRGDGRRMFVWMIDGVAGLIRSINKLFEAWRYAAQFLPDWLGGGLLSRTADAAIASVNSMADAVRSLGDEYREQLKAEDAAAQAQRDRVRKSKELAEQQRAMRKRMNDESIRDAKERDAAMERSGRVAERAQASGAAPVVPVATGEAATGGMTGGQGGGPVGASGGGSSGSSAVGSGATPKAEVGPIRAGTREGSPIQPLSADDAARMFGSDFKSATKEQIDTVYSAFKQQMVDALTPDANGIVDPARAQQAFSNWRNILSQLPGYSAEAMEKIKADLNAVGQSMGGATVEMAGFYKQRVEDALGNVEDVVVTSDEKNQAILANLAKGGGKAAGEQMRGVSQMMNQKIAELRGKVGQGDIQQMVQMRNNLVNQLRIVGNSHGEAKEKALKALEEMLAAYKKTYGEIQKRAETTMSATATAAEKAAARGAGAAERAQQGAADRRDRIAARRASGGVSGASGFTAIGNMSQQLSGLFTGALQGIGAGAAAFGQVMQQAGNPLQRLDLLIQNVTARIGSAEINQRVTGGAGGGALDQLRAEKQDLERQRSLILARQAEDKQRNQRNLLDRYKDLRAEQAAQVLDDTSDRPLFFTSSGRSPALSGAGALGQARALEQQASAADRALSRGGAQSGTGYTINLYGISDLKEATAAISNQMKRNGVNRRDPRVVT
jgi:TP901 family phage tail tape measure protein